MPSKSTQLRPIFYDTETTGIKYDRDFIIEIAAYDPEQERTFEKLINPGAPIPKEATAVHHITDEMVAEAAPFSEVSKEFIKFCEGDVVLIAHNNDSFDLPFLRSEFARNQLEIPEWKFLDSLKWARKYRPDLPKHTLQFLREIYGFAANTAHRAMDDVYILEKVFSAMVDNLSIDTCLNLLSKNREVNQMPFGKHRGLPLNQVPKNYFKWLLGSGALDKPGSEELKESIEKLHPSLFAS